MFSSVKNRNLLYFLKHKLNLYYILNPKNLDNYFVNDIFLNLILPKWPKGLFINYVTQISGFFTDENMIVK